MRNNKIQRIITVILTMVFAISVMNFQVFAFKVGEDVPTITVDDGSFEVDLFKLEDYPSSITLSSSSCKLKSGESVYISYTMLPQNTGQNFRNISWSSSNINVATISSDTTYGLSGGITVYGVGSGTSTISATTKNGITSACTVTVESEPTSITVTPTSAQMQSGETLSLSATILPADAANKSVTWSSSDSSVAAVDQYGTVTAKKGGTAVITASTYNGFAESCAINVKSEPVSITLNTHNVSLEVNQEVSLSYTIDPADVQSAQVTWSSSNSSVASVDQYGTVIGLKAGSAAITVTTSNGKSDKATVTVQKAVPQSITLSASSKTITVGDTDTLKATISPTDAKDDPIAWFSDNPSVALVDSNGKIAAKSAGSANITVTTSNGLTASCSVTVKAVEPSSISLSATSHTMNIGDTFTLTKTIKPDEAKDDKVTWASSNTSVATVSEGTVTAKAVGTTTITVKTSNNKTATCAITVKTIEPTSIALSASSHTMSIGEEFTLTTTIKPDGSKDDKVTWTSSNTSVAAVSGGTVTAKAVGTTTITVKTSNGKTATCAITVKVPEAASVTVSSTSTTLEIGKTAAVTATVEPSAANQSVTWSTSDSNVATVSTNGIITAKSAGTANITAKTSNGKTSSCKITVKAIEATSVALSASSKELEAGKSFTLYATVSPTNTTDKSVTWKSSDTNVAIVSDGKVTAKAVGAATITATTKNGKTATCKITVPDKVVESVALNKSSAELAVGETLAITATISPSDAGDKTLTWFSNNEDVATVDSKGNISAICAGKATITVKSANGKIANCVVSVNSNEEYAIKFKTHEVSIRVGETKQLEYDPIPDNVEIEFYSPNNNGYLEIDSRGKITAKKVGVVSIDARIGDSEWDYVNITIGQSQEDEAAARQEYIEQILYYVNVEREKAGLEPVELMPELSALAQIRTDEQVEVGDISHTRPDGSSYRTVFSGSGVSYKVTGENLIMGAGWTPEGAVNAWMKSPGHRANILRERFKYMGIGVEFTNSSCKGGYIITQLFIG